MGAHGGSLEDSSFTGDAAPLGEDDLVVVKDEAVVVC